jgi:predicted dehydrogenase
MSTTANFPYNEKPLASKLDDAKEIVDVASKHNKTIVYYP